MILLGSLQRIHAEFVRINYLSNSFNKTLIFVHVRVHVHVLGHTHAIT